MKTLVVVMILFTLLGCERHADDPEGEARNFLIEELNSKEEYSWLLKNLSFFHVTEVEGGFIVVLRQLTDGPHSNPNNIFSVYRIFSCYIETEGETFKFEWMAFGSVEIMRMYREVADISEFWIALEEGRSREHIVIQ